MSIVQCAIAYNCANRWVGLPPARHRRMLDDASSAFTMRVKRGNGNAYLAKFVLDDFAVTKRRLAIRDEVEASTMSVGPARQFMRRGHHVGLMVQSSPTRLKNGAKSRAFRYEVSNVWRIVAFLRRYGFRQVTIWGQRSGSGRPIAKEKRPVASDAGSVTLRVMGD